MNAEKRSPKPIAGAQCGHCGADATRRDGDVLRCECGSLLARYVAGRLELKCRRCKRTVMVPAGTPEGGTG